MYSVVPTLHPPSSFPSQLVTISSHSHLPLAQHVADSIDTIPMTEYPSKSQKELSSSQLLGSPRPRGGSLSHSNGGVKARLRRLRDTLPHPISILSERLVKVRQEIAIPDTPAVLLVTVVLVALSELGTLPANDQPF